MAPSVLLSALPSVFQKPLVHSSPSQSNAGVGNELDIPWTDARPAHSHLLSELQNMYWDGVERELMYILLTLREWQLPKYEGVVLEDEGDDFVHGYDTFLDQVSLESREFARRYGMSIAILLNAAATTEILRLCIPTNSNTTTALCVLHTWPYGTTLD